MLRIVSPLALGLVLAACGGDDAASDEAPFGDDDPVAETAPAGEAVRITLEEQRDSGLSGTAELWADNGDTLVVVELDDPEVVFPSAYLQEGDCTAPTPETAEVLALFLEGRSETNLDVELESLLEGRYVVSVYEEVEPDLEHPAACAEIRREGS